MKLPNYKTIAVMSALLAPGAAYVTHSAKDMPMRTVQKYAPQTFALIENQQKQQTALEKILAYEQKQVSTELAPYTVEYHNYLEAKNTHTEAQLEAATISTVESRERGERALARGELNQFAREAIGYCGLATLIGIGLLAGREQYKMRISQDRCNQAKDITPK
jgi:hypothetical protein